MPSRSTSAATSDPRLHVQFDKAVESNGKHLMITFTTDGEDVVLHTHMKMTGEWHVYRPGERWRAEPSDARVVIRTDAFVAPCFHPPIVALLTAGELAIHPLLSALGPDVIAEVFDEDEALRRMRRDPFRHRAHADGPAPAHRVGGHDPRPAGGGGRSRAGGVVVLRRSPARPARPHRQRNCVIHVGRHRLLGACPARPHPYHPVPGPPHERHRRRRGSAHRRRWSRRCRRWRARG